MKNDKRYQPLIALVITGALIGQSFLGLPVYADVENTTLPQQSTQVGKVQSQNQELVVGQTYNGFKLTQKTFSKDLNADVYDFAHEKNGGRLIYFANDDPNKYFNIAFKTPAVDDTGVNHILEHTVLEGSEKYPFKSPYTEMSKRSVSTFMNAFTGCDVTYYPVASENDQDFQNLMSFYLDATLAPVVVKNKMLMKQEGWRYEIDPQTGAISFNGVVFNELKGAMADKYDTILSKVPAVLYPDTKFKFNSGGDPESIVDLTHDQLAATYKKYYTPGNGCITLYGKMDIREKLKYINDNYYSKSDLQSAIEDKKEQTPFTEPKEMTMSYPADPSARVEKDSILTWNLAISKANAKDRLGLEILMQLITDGDDAPLFTKLVGQDIGRDVNGGVYQEYYQPLFSIMLEGANPNDMKDYDKIIKGTLRGLAAKGIPKERILAVMNSDELGLKTSLLSANKGERAVNLVDSGFVTYGDPTLNLNQAELLKEIKNSALNGNYFEDLLKKYILNNNHLAKITFTPERNVMSELEKRLSQKLDDRIKSMTPEALQALKDDVKAYDAYEEQPTDSEALKQLPSLKISDLDLTTKKVVVNEKKVSGIKVFEHPVSSLGLTQVNMYFDLRTLTQNELLYLDLFKEVIDGADTKKYNNETFANLEGTYTGGIYIDDLVVQDPVVKDKYSPYLTVSSTFLSENGEESTELLQQLMTQAQFNNKERVKSVLKNIVEARKTQKTNEGADVSQSRLMASLSQAGALQDLRMNEGYKTMVAADKNYNKSYPEIIKNLNSIYSKVFNKNNLTCSIVTDQSHLAAYEKQATPLWSSLKSNPIKLNTWHFAVKKQKTAMIIPSEMQFIQVGFNVKDNQQKVTGQDYVFAQMLNDGYMYENIRLKGGAYGGDFSASSSGYFIFSTYRDPNLKESVKIIERAAEFLKNYQPSQEDVDHAIVSVAGRDNKSEDLFTTAAVEDAKRLIHYDPKREEQIKREMLSTKVEDLKAFADKVLAGMKNSSLVVAGSESKIKENKALFDTIGYSAQ